MGAKALAAEKPDKNAQKPDKTPKPANENAAPVLPKPSPKTTRRLVVNARPHRRFSHWK